MKRTTFTLATLVALSASTFAASIKLTLDQPLFVAGTKANAKMLEDMPEDRDAGGIVAAQDESVDRLVNLVLPCQRGCVGRGRYCPL
jgi:hypothetical protein